MADLTIVDATHRDRLCDAVENFEKAARFLQEQIAAAEADDLSILARVIARYDQKPDHASVVVTDTLRLTVRLEATRKIL